MKYRVTMEFDSMDRIEKLIKERGVRPISDVSFVNGATFPTPKSQSGRGVKFIIMEMLSVRSVGDAVSLAEMKEAVHAEGYDIGISSRVHEVCEAGFLKNDDPGRGVYTIIRVPDVLDMKSPSRAVVIARQAARNVFGGK